MVASSRDAIASPPSPTQLELKRIRAGDKQCCRKLIELWETAIWIIASRYMSRQSDLDDLMQVGRLGVYVAALNYKASCMVPFAHYAKRTIKNRVLTEAVRLTGQRSHETSMSENTAVDDSPYPKLKYAEHLMLVKEWVRDLSEPHATIFRLLYLERVKQREAGQILRVSQPRVAQMHRGLLEVARAALAD